jgi:hypothetical protein
MPYPVDTVTTTGAFLLVLALVVPVVSVLIAFVAGGRHAERIALTTLPLGLAIATPSPSRCGERAARWFISSAAGHRRWAWRCARTAYRWSCWQSRPW